MPSKTLDPPADVIHGAAFDAITRPLWTPNPAGAREMAKAVEIARAMGILIPDDIWFVVAELKADRDAEYGSFLSDQDVRWADFYTDGEEPVIPVRISKAVLLSDVAIVAVLGHEMYELNALRDMFASCGTMKGAMLDLHLRKNREHNLHWHAWEEADERVIAMLKKDDAE